jgi:hypothetical protein
VRRLATLTLFALLCTAVSSQAAGPRILVTGDSMMRGVDGGLQQELEAIQELSFRSEVHIGEGVTKAPWVRRARRQAREHVPNATVAFMGANDCFDMFRAPCCREKWVAKYEDRVTRMIRAYLREGRAEAYWLTLPASSMRSARRRFIFPKINAAIRRAVEASGPHAHLVDAWTVFTPGGQYRTTMPWKGAELVVRSADGVHLSKPGQGIAAELIRDALLADGVVSYPAPP